MHRSGSLNRSLDALSVSVSPSQVKGSPALKSATTASVDLLPRYRQSTDHSAKKQARFNAEHAVHLIPVMLLLCAFILWISTQPGTHAIGSVLEEGEMVLNTVGNVLKESETTLAGGLIINTNMNVEERIKGGFNAENVSKVVSVDR